MDGDFFKGDNVTHRHDAHLAPTSSPLRSDYTFPGRHLKGMEQEIDTQTSRNSEPHAKKRIRVDDNVDNAHSDHSHQHSPHAHVHKRKRSSPPSASMRLYRRSLTLALLRARRQPITRSLTTRLTRSGAKFFKHDLYSELPLPSSRSANLHGEHHHTPTLPHGSPLHGSPRRKHADMRASPSKIALNCSPKKSTDEDALLDLNEDIAIRYLNSTPSFYTLLDLDFNLSDEINAPSASSLPNEDPLYLGPKDDIAIKYHGSSPKLYTSLDGMDFDVLLDSPTPSSPKASSPIVEDSHVKPHSPASLKRSMPRTRASSSSSSPRGHNLQDHHDSKLRPPSFSPSSFKHHAGKSMDPLLSLTAPLPSPSPSFTSPKYAPSGKSVSRRRSHRSSRSPSLSYSPKSPKHAPAAGKSIASLFATRSPSPSYSPASPKHAHSRGKRVPRLLATKSPALSYTPASPKLPIGSPSPSSSPTLPMHAPSGGKSVTHLLAMRSPSPSYSPVSIQYASSSLQDSRNALPSLEPRSPCYSPTSSSSQSSSTEHNNHLFSSRSPSPKRRYMCNSPTSSCLESSSPRHNNYLFPSRSPSPKRAPISPTYHVPSPSLNKDPKGKLPSVPSFKPSKPRIYKFKDSDSSSSPSFTSPRKRWRSRSPASFDHPSTSRYHSPKSPSNLIPSSHQKHSPKTNLRAPKIKYSTNVDELIQSLSSYWNPVDERTPSPPTQSCPPNRSAWNNPSSRARSPSLSGQGSPTSSAFVDHYSQVRPTYSLYPMSSPRRSAHRHTPRLPDLNFSPPCQSWSSSSTSGQGLPLYQSFWFRGRGNPPSLSSRSTESPCSPSGQHHVTFSSCTNSSPNTHRRLGERMANNAQNNRYSRPYRQTPHTSYIQPFESNPQTGSSETLPSIESALSTPMGWKSSNEGVLPWQSHGVPSPTSSKRTSYYSALSSPSWYRDVSSRYQGVAPSSRMHLADIPHLTSSEHTSSYSSALRSPSWYQDEPSKSSPNTRSTAASEQEIYYSAQSAPLSYHTAPCSPPWYQPHVTTSEQETYFSAQSKLSPSPPAVSHAMLDRNQHPLDQETYWSATSTPSPGFYYNSQATKRRTIPSASANIMEASTSSSAYCDYNRATSARTLGPASTSTSREHSSTRSPPRTARSSRKRPSSAEKGKAAFKQHKSH